MRLLERVQVTDTRRLQNTNGPPGVSVTFHFDDGSLSVPMPFKKHAVELADALNAALRVRAPSEGSPTDGV